MESKSVIRERTEASEASIRDYLHQFFCIEEVDLSQAKQTLLAESLNMPAEDVRKVPGVSFNRVSWLDPIDSSQTPDALVPVKDIDIPEHLGNVKCYRFSLRGSAEYFIKKHCNKNLEEQARWRREHELRLEERRIWAISVFRFSSLLPFIHHQCPIITKAMEEYKKLESLKELQRLVSGLSPYTGCNRPKRDFRI